MRNEIDPKSSQYALIAQNTGVDFEAAISEAHKALAQPILAAFVETKPTTTLADVAEGVWRAVHGETGAMRFRPAPTPSRWRTAAS